MNGQNNNHQQKIQHNEMKALSVIVVPMETNLEPYQLELNIKGILFITLLHINI